MNPSPLRSAAFGGLLGLALCAGVHAQAAPGPTQAGLPDFTGIVARNAPAVVHVEAEYNGGQSHQQGVPTQGVPGGDPQEEILRRFFGMPAMPSPEEQAHTSLGSGFILSKDGYILTNDHVVEDADAVTVRLQDRRTLKAKVVGKDPNYDIALLKVDAHDLPVVTIGDSRSLKPGQWVLAIGSPFGFDYTVTQGIVSAVGRNLGTGDQPYTSFIQTDVPINRGNSGGPLFDLQGRVVGMNSQIYSNTGGYLGVAFSIPIDVAMNAVQQIKAKGYVTRGLLGVHVQNIDAELARAFKLERGAGAAVTDVEPGSGAAKAGLQPNDVILAYNGQPIDQAADLPPLVGMTKPGTSVPVVILRNGNRQTVQVTVGEAPREDQGTQGNGRPGATHGSAALGFSVQGLDNDTRRQLGLSPGEGVVIADITGPVAARAGLQPGDVILSVNQKKVGSVAAFDAATHGVKPGSTVLLLVRRDDQTRFIALTVPGGQGNGK